MASVGGRLGAALGTFIFFWMAPGTVAGVTPYALTRWRMGPDLIGLSAGRLLGDILICAGATVVVESFVRFAIVGRGTPAPVAPTESLVLSGLYRCVRNPMYVGVLAVILGQAMLLRSGTLLAYAGLIWLLFHAFTVLYEEPTLRRQFGSAYDTYRAGVRRWWPRITPWRDSGRG